ncbi:MAG: PD-(D/E)XK nuclease domain-containing protein [Deltaproteobacteria bacterium]|nr:PD-(D/E)XK nuclease domain-containing protein [Deltaproteobacteria bacterium]
MSAGRPGLAIHCGSQAWVIEVKLSHKDKDDKRLANDAQKQIHLNNYAGGNRDPVLLGLAINDNKRTITSWECQGGLMSKPQDKAPGTEDGEQGRPGPRLRP